MEQRIYFVKVDRGQEGVGAILVMARSFIDAAALATPAAEQMDGSITSIELVAHGPWSHVIAHTP